MTGLFFFVSVYLLFFITRPAKIADVVGRLFRLRFRKGSCSESIYYTFLRTTRQWHVWNWCQIIERSRNIGGSTKKRSHFYFVYYTFVHRFEVFYRGLGLGFVARALLQRTLRVAILKHGSNASVLSPRPRSISDFSVHFCIMVLDIPGFHCF